MTFNNKRGIALVYVLASVMVISAVAVEIAYKSHISYHLASYRRDEVQAQWLLRSASAFGKLLLKYDKELRQQFASVGPVAGVNMNGPFCAQMPFNTAILRGIFNVNSEDSAKSTKDEKEAPKGQDKEPATDLVGGGILASKEAQDFLSFVGDFGLECADEQAKFNINYFYESPPPLDPNTTTYDDHKSLLAAILAGESFKEFFKDPRDAVTLAGAIADWVDKDENINDYGRVVRGYESSLYPADVTYRVKNGKFSSLEELHLVAGMTDDIYDVLVPQITLYGDNKINICMATPDVVAGLAIQYSKTSGRTAPLAPDNKTVIDKIVEAVKKQCASTAPDAGQIGQRIEEILGAAPISSMGLAPSPATSATSPNNFASMITTQSRFLSLKINATVGETELKGELVLDTNGPPAQWKNLYYRVY